MGYIEIKSRQLSVTFKIWPLLVSAASPLTLSAQDLLTIHAVLLAVPLCAHGFHFSTPLLLTTFQPRLLPTLPTLCICKLLFQNSFPGHIFSEAFSNFSLMWSK